MRIHILSDLHREFKPYEPTSGALEADVIILAGDIDIKCRGVKWANSAFSQPVIYVPGNHEYYGGHLDRTLAKMRDLAEPHVHVMDRDVLTIDGVRFLGATGWTNYSSTGNQPLAEIQAKISMHDFKKIRAGESYRKVSTLDFIKKNEYTRCWLVEQLSAPFEGETIVVTHYAPSMLSLNNEDRHGHLDAAYANQWEGLMGEHMTWIHGHSHHAVDYEINGCRVISNPKGYPGEHTGFCSDFILDCPGNDFSPSFQL